MEQTFLRIDKASGAVSLQMYANGFEDEEEVLEEGLAADINGDPSEQYVSTSLISS
jgi:hypothetical protein